MRLLDTDVLIDYQRGNEACRIWFASLPELPSIPGLVVMELIQDANTKQQMQDVLKIVAPLPIVWPTDADCRRALADFTSLHMSHGLGLLDALIASCAVGLDATLCTFNVKHYRAVPSLTTEQPYER